MKWMHKCKLEWLDARRMFLTATDVRELVPFTKSGRPRKIGRDEYVKVFAKKLPAPTEDDCYSYGPAARGHVLEPWAVEKFNSTYGLEHGIRLFHWDDAVVTRPTIETSLGFSPDAMDVEQKTVDTICSTCLPTCIGEVKSYSADRHMLAGITDKGDLEERWQVAVAMAVCPSISTGFLLFYNPSVANSMYVFRYSREDLEDEISAVLDVEREWNRFVGDKSWSDNPSVEVVTGDPGEEAMIVDTILKREELDPVKTVSL